MATTAAITTSNTTTREEAATAGEDSIRGSGRLGQGPPGTPMERRRPSAAEAADARSTTEAMVMLLGQMIINSII
jgi:hypothetical protein